MQADELLKKHLAYNQNISVGHNTTPKPKGVLNVDFLINQGTLYGPIIRLPIAG